MNGLNDAELPAGWARVSLGEICIPVDQVGADGFPSTRFRYIDIGSVSGSTRQIASADWIESAQAPGRARQVVQAGDTVYSTVRPYLRKIAHIPDELNGHIASTGFAVIRPHHEISHRYVFYAVQSRLFEQQLFPKQRGVSYPAVRDVDVFETTIPLPPIPEQHRIVDAIEDHLSRIDAGSRDLTVARRKAARLRSILYHQAVTGAFSRPVRIDEVIEESAVRSASSLLATRRWKPAPPVRVDGYTPPANWTTISLGTLSYSSGYGTSTKCAYGAPGHPVLRIPNVQGGSIDLTDIKNAVDPALDLSKFFLDCGDILFVRTNGSPTLIGRVGVVEKRLPYAFASYLIRFRLTPGFVEPRWIQLVTQSPLWRKEIERYAASSAGQFNLNAEILSQLPVPLPPLDVQRETLEAVDAAATGASRLTATCDAGLARSTNLRSSILHRAFTGRLVPQNPADEPASAVLDRIRVERENNSGKPKRAARRARGTTTTTDASLPPPATPAHALTHAVQQELPL